MLDLKSPVALLTNNNKSYHQDISCCCFSPRAEERGQDTTAVSNIRESDECPENQATTIALQGQEG